MAHLPSVYRVFARRLGGVLDAQVLLPDYRLAPEHPFPAGSDDCLDAYRWLLTRGFDAKRVIIAGDSAGGNLALVTAMRVRDEGLPSPGCVVMVPEALEFVRTTYAPSADWRHRWISPIHDSFGGLPPLLFHAGSTELIVDDSIRAAEKARSAGVCVELLVWPGMPHVFQAHNALPEAKEAIAQIARFVRQHVPPPHVDAADLRPDAPAGTS